MAFLMIIIIRVQQITFNALGQEGKKIKNKKDRNGI